MLLLDLLRDLGLTGAKPSCEMEVCGACTVLSTGCRSARCTALAIELDGRTVETVEGLGDAEPARTRSSRRSSSGRRSSAGSARRAC